MDENPRKRKNSSNILNTTDYIEDCVVIDNDTSEEPSEKQPKICDISNSNHNLDLQDNSENVQSTTDVIVIESDDREMEECLSRQTSFIAGSQQSSGYYSQQTGGSQESESEGFVILDTDSSDKADVANESPETIEIVEDEVVAVDLSKDSKSDADVTVVNEVDVLDNSQPKNEIKDIERSVTNTDVPSSCEQSLNDSLSMNETNVQNEQLPLEDGEVVDGETSFNNCIQIKFSDKTVADLYKLKFLKFLQNFIELDVNVENELSINISRDTALNSNEWVVLENTTELNENYDSTPSKKRNKKKKKELFVVDTNPSLTSSKRSKAAKYNTKFFIEDLPKTDAEDDDSKKPKNTPTTQTCFNCGKNHALKDCTEKKDYKKINSAKQLFRSKSIRYHVEENQKYSHLKPGQISNKLRDALGLHSNQLPPYIYNMRLLGYPPGWLEEAKVEESNLTLFDIDGKSLKSTAKPKYGLDPNKVIDYHGFNVPPKSGFKDEYMHYNTPPYLKQFKKEAMIEYFNKQFLREQDNLETCDMDLDADEEGQTQTAEKAEVQQAKIEENNETSPESLSLVELEKQKENLLAALDDNNSNAVNLQDEESSSNTQDSICNTPLKESSAKTIDSVTPSADKERLSIVKTSSFGTPVLKSSSPYQSLPNPVNFSKNVSPVLNFENLPNSTGKYKQMTNVLEKVRTTLKSLQNCKS